MKIILTKFINLIEMMVKKNIVRRILCCVRLCNPRLHGGDRYPAAAASEDSTPVNYSYASVSPPGSFDTIFSPPVITCLVKSCLGTLRLMRGGDSRLRREVFDRLLLGSR